MKRILISFIVVLFAITGSSPVSISNADTLPEELPPVCNDGYCDATEQADPSLCPADCDMPGEIPYYFIAVHNEPTMADMENNYRALKDLVEKANTYNMKLTLMFTPEWVRFLRSDPKKDAHFVRWVSQGHEIAGHHHSIWHRGRWDGFTYLPEELALRIRRVMGKHEPYLGDLYDYISVLRHLNPDIHSGCMNDQFDKRVMPDQIVYDTCSGFANFGPPGRRMGDRFAVKGINMYATAGTVNAIERVWLTHAVVTTDQQVKRAEEVFSHMNRGVYGVVTHSRKPQVESMIDFMEVIHGLDPSGEKSKTLTEIVDEGLLPEVNLPSIITEVAE